VSADRELILSPLRDNESLSDQLENVRLCGVSTMTEASLKWSLNYLRKLATFVRIMTGFSTVKKADVKEVTSSTSSQSPKKNVL
jgi:hypothetical protein